MTPCEGCAADCCRHFDVVVLGWDVHRIARDLGLPPASFIELQGAPAPDVSHQLILDANAPERRYHRLAMKKRDGACVFLLPLGGVGRCGVYASRPDACRTYPAILDGDLLTLAKREYCPPGSWEDLDDAIYRPRYRFGQQQRDIHDVIGDGWNERILVRRESRTEGELFAYLIDVYAELERRVPEWFSGPIGVGEEELRGQIGTMLAELGWLT